MRSNLLPCALVLFPGLATAQTATNAEPQTQVGKTAPGLPQFMLEVPGGRITLGLDAKSLMDQVRELEPRNENRQLLLVRHLLAELGETTADVKPFFLARFPVTNKQYKLFVEAKGVRFPFDWWKEGQKKDFESRMEEIAKMPSMALDKNIAYWEANWKTLPWAIPEGREDMPVTYISWRDAVAYASWVGMRLPYEAEWLMAATGGKMRQFLPGDKWDPQWLDAMQIKRARDMKLKRVGAISQIARGPFGHDDLMSGVWEWMQDVTGYRPLADAKEFAKEYDKLIKDKLLREASGFYPEWEDNRRILKGGAYLSGTDPVQLRLGTRGPAAPDETQPSIGFRLAKSLEPGRDMCLGRIRIEYDYSFFGDRTPLTDDQVGIERYEMDGELIRSYHSISAVPISEMVDPGKLKPDELSLQRPIILGTLLTTEKLANPALEAGLYTVCYRAKGIPDELREAMNEGRKELALAARAAAAAKAGSKPPKEEEPKEQRGPDWRAVTKRYGVDEEQVKAGVGKLETIVLQEGELRVPVGTALLVFKDNGTMDAPPKFVAAVPTEDKLVPRGGYRGAGVELHTDDRSGKQTLRFQIGVPEGRNRHVVMRVDLQTSEPIDPAAWRLPTP